MLSLLGYLSNVEMTPVMCAIYLYHLIEKFLGVGGMIKWLWKLKLLLVRIAWGNPYFYLTVQINEEKLNAAQIGQWYGRRSCSRSIIIDCSVVCMYHGHKCSMFSYSPGVHWACGLACFCTMYAPILELFVLLNWLVIFSTAVTFGHATLQWRGSSIMGIRILRLLTSSLKCWS